MIWGTCAAISYKIKLGRICSLLEKSRVSGLCQGKYWTNECLWFFWLKHTDIMELNKGILSIVLKIAGRNNNAMWLSKSADRNECYVLEFRAMMLFSHTWTLPQSSDLCSIIWVCLAHGIEHLCAWETGRLGYFWDINKVQKAHYRRLHSLMIVPFCFYFISIMDMQ